MKNSAIKALVVPVLGISNVSLPSISLGKICSLLEKKFQIIIQEFQVVIQDNPKEFGHYLCIYSNEEEASRSLERILKNNHLRTFPSTPGAEMSIGAGKYLFTTLVMATDHQAIIPILEKEGIQIEIKNVNCDDTDDKSKEPFPIGNYGAEIGVSFDQKGIF